jgi:C1A family cysteine protease
MYDYMENSTIPEKAFEEAKKYKVSSYLRVYTTDEIRKAIYQYGPVLGSFAITQEFMRMSSDGIVKPRGNSPWVGNHAMTIIGYDDTKKMFKIQNSWGKDWGDHGFCYMPYDVLEHFVIDLWLVVDDKSPKAGAKYIAYKIWQNFKIQLEKNKAAAVMGLLFGSIVLLNAVFTKKKPV